MVDGAIDDDGIRWARCPNCGDSATNRHKAHMLIDTKGSTYCYKCGHSSQLSIGDLIDVALGNKSVDEAVEAAELGIRDEARTFRRPSLLTVFSDDTPGADAFEMRNQHGERTGWHIRYPGKKFSNEGDRGIGFIGNWLVSRPFEPLVVVEGPYDVVKPNYVCTFGTMNAGNLAKFFRMQFVWLFPDQDIVANKTTRARFADQVIKPALDAMVFIQGVILAPGDPDEVEDNQRQWLTTEAVLADWGTESARDFSNVFSD